MHIVPLPQPVGARFANLAENATSCRRRGIKCIAVICLRYPLFSLPDEAPPAVFFVKHKAPSRAMKRANSNGRLDVRFVHSAIQDRRIDSEPLVRESGAQCRYSVRQIEFGHSLLR